MPKNSVLEWDTVAANNTDIAGIGIQGTSAVSNFDGALRTIMAQVKSGIDYKQTYTAKAANYTALATDNNALINVTATGVTISLTAAATLGVNWHCIVYANGFDVTVDPNGAELINDAATLLINNGAYALITCTGTAFIANVALSQIQPLFTIASATTTNLSTVSTIMKRAAIAEYLPEKTDIGRRNMSAIHEDFKELAERLGYKVEKVK